MKKTLIALALTALPVAAMADVTLYGKIKAGVEYVDVGSASDTHLLDWGSYIGFKGSEDLGNGLKAIWQIEQGAKISPNLNKDKGWANRDSFIGLSGGFGTIRAGYLSDSLKDGGSELDFWEADDSDFRKFVKAGYSESILSLGRYTRNEDRATAVRYDSPSFGGFDFNLYYAPETNLTVDGFGKGTGANNVATVGINYKNQGFFVGYGFKLVNHYGPRDDQNVHRIEAGYDANNLFVGIGYQFDKDGIDATDSYQEAALSVAYKAGNFTPKLSYAHGFKSDNVAKYDQVILGVDYAFSKRTTALINGGWLDQGGNSDDQYAVGIGLVHKF